MTLRLIIVKAIYSLKQLNKMIKRIIIAVIAFVVCIACVDSSHSKIESTVICGEVINFDTLSAKVLTVLPYEFIVEGKRHAIDLSKSNYKFSQEFTMTHKHDVAINYNREFYIFMAEPGDSIFVSIDAKTKDITFSGSKAEFNQQVVSARKVSNRKFNELYEINLDTDVNGVVAQLEQKMAAIRDTLDLYSKTNNISEEAKQYLLDDHLYGFANYILSFDRENQVSPERLKLKLDDIFDLYNPQKAHSFMFSMHVSNLMYDFMKSNLDFQTEITKEVKDVPKVTKLMLDNILTLQKSVMRDILLTTSLSSMTRSSNKIEDIYEPRFLDAQNYYNPKFLELYIRPILEPKKQPEADLIQGDVDFISDIKYINSKNEIENIGNKDIFSYVREKYKGKVIYIDVWATWCGPCIIEMGHAKALHEMYKDRDDVEFVNLCLSSKADAWVKTIKDRRIGGENYFVSGDDAAKMILSKYKLAGYPSYILIGKDGKIVTTSASRPSELQELSEELERLF